MIWCFEKAAKSLSSSNSEIMKYLKKINVTFELNMSAVLQNFHQLWENISSLTLSTLEKFMSHSPSLFFFQRDIFIRDSRWLSQSKMRIRNAQALLSFGFLLENEAICPFQRAMFSKQVTSATRRFLQFL